MDNKVHEILSRGVADVIVRSELENKLKSGKKLRVKFGIDPTGCDLHLGHAVVLNKLRQFQDAGHTCILLIGDYTARIGDPTGKSKTRKVLDSSDIEKNMATYLEQAGKILDLDSLEVRYNSEWYGKMDMGQILALAGKRTVNQMLQREDFKNRMADNREISMVELMYPLMQGYDSVPLECDVEIGGTDQLFNMLVGRDLQSLYGLNLKQNVLTVPILEGLDGKEKMSKSLNNYIAFNDSAKDMYGKALSLPDELILRYFELATAFSSEEIAALAAKLEAGENPKNVKMTLARELVSFYHSREEAKLAEEEFNNVFAKGEVPEDVELQLVGAKEVVLVDLLHELGLVASKGEGRRLAAAGAVKVDGEKVMSFDELINVEEERLLKVGKRKFKKVKYAK